jgi:sugar lactone lactonase YvrE
MYNHKIRKITAAGVVTTIAGSGAGGSSEGAGASASFLYPTGIAIDTYGVVYVADTYNQKIRKITAAGVVSTIAGSGSQGSRDGDGANASFLYPKAVAVDASGTLYVADTNNHKIRKITPQ